MGRKTPKGKKGKAANLVSSKDLRARIGLQDDKDIRRAQILRGVYPRENPKQRNNPEANFHRKDVAMLAYDQMTEFIRSHNAYLIKKNKAMHRQEHIPKNEPKAPYAELIRSRYPTFADALRDLDDALTTIALFSQLSGNSKIPTEKVNRCRELLTEFHYYVSHTHSLKYAFISVRGFHFEANIEGQSILWLIPHDFPIPIPPESEVDFDVLLNFLELYEQLLKFVNTKLFIELGMKYPPEFDKKKWDEGLYFDAIQDTRTIPVEETQMATPAPENAATTNKLQQALQVASSTAVETNETPEFDRGLFGDFVFTICRGTHRNAISFIIRNLGGGINWNEETDDPAITHTVTDRGAIEMHYLNRKYVQSQWVVDCLNQKQVLDADLYAPNVELPPHLSPWDAPQEDIEEIGEDDEREIIAGSEDSDQEIDEEIRRSAMEADYAEGMRQELQGEEGEEKEEKSVSQKRAELKQKKKEERERLAAGTLTASKMKIYKELKEKEEKRKRKQPFKDDMELDETLHLAEEEEEVDENAH